MLSRRLGYLYIDAASSVIIGYLLVPGTLLLLLPMGVTAPGRHDTIAGMNLL